MESKNSMPLIFPKEKKFLEKSNKSQSALSIILLYIIKIYLVYKIQKILVNMKTRIIVHI